jgi:hypothetical protein
MFELSDYLCRKLSERNLTEVVCSCRSALRQGYLDDEPWEKEGIYNALNMRDFNEFRIRRKEACEKYDSFCKLLCTSLPEIEKMANNMDKVKKLVSLYEKVLRLDGERRFYDRGLDDVLGETILNFFIIKLEKYLRKICAQELLWDIVNGYFFDSFRVEMLIEYVSFLKLLPKGEKTLELLTVLDLKELPEEILVEFNKLASKYTHSNWENNLAKLKMYGHFSGVEKETLQELAENKEVRIRKRFYALEFVRIRLGNQNRYNEVIETLKIIDELLFYNAYEDELRHGTMNPDLADYFLREEVAKTLYEVGVIPSSRSTDYPQRYLLKMMSSLLELKINFTNT